MLRPCFGCVIDIYVRIYLYSFIFLMYVLKIFQIHIYFMNKKAKFRTIQIFTVLLFFFFIKMHFLFCTMKIIIHLYMYNINKSIIIIILKNL